MFEYPLQFHRVGTVLLRKKKSHRKLQLNNKVWKFFFSRVNLDRLLTRLCMETAALINQVLVTYRSKKKTVFSKMNYNTMILRQPKHKLLLLVHHLCKAFYPWTSIFRRIISLWGLKMEFKTLSHIECKSSSWRRTICIFDFAHLHRSRFVPRTSRLRDGLFNH